MEKNKNFTLSVPGPLLKKLRVYAALHEKSMTAVINEAIEKIVAEEGHEERMRRALEMMRNATDLGTNGSFNREELYDRIR